MGHWLCFASDARLRVQLTNALEPSKDFATEFTFIGDAMANEAHDANAAKKTHFTAVIGNPPYKGHSANPSKYKIGKLKGKLTPAGELIQHYFKVDGQPLGEKNPKWVNNDYVKFLAFAEKLIKDSGVGAIGYITSNSWLDSPTFRGVRASLLKSFPKLWLVDCHGNSQKKERAEDGGPDDNVFEIEEGTNVSIGLLTANGASVFSKDLRGPLDGPHGKFTWFESSPLKSAVSASLKPTAPVYLLFQFKTENGSEVAGWETAEKIMTRFTLGYQSHRDEFATDLSRSELKARLVDMADAKITDENFNSKYSNFYPKTWKFSKARAGYNFEDNEIKPIQISPFDDRYCSISKKVGDRPRTLFIDHVYDRDNLLIFLNRQTKAKYWHHTFATKEAASAVVLEIKDGATAFPLWLSPTLTEPRPLPNIAPAFANRVAALTDLRYDDGSDAPAQAALAGVIVPKPEQVAMFGERRERGDGGATSFGPRDLFDWIYAVLHSPAYRARYADYLKSDFARIPLPKDKELFQALIPLGTRLVALHLLDIKAALDLADPKSVRLAGTGEARVTFKSSEFEKSAWDGGRMYIAADKSRWFETVPERVANFHIGGYRPARKWLKDRTASGGKRPSRGRILSEADILHYRRMIVAMDQTIDLMAQIDTVIEEHGGWPDAFRGMVD
jgi:predicted helicase